MEYVLEQMSRTSLYVRVTAETGCRGIEATAGKHVVHKPAVGNAAVAILERVNEQLKPTQRRWPRQIGSRPLSSIWRFA